MHPVQGVGRATDAGGCAGIIDKKPRPRSLIHPGAWAHPEPKGNARCQPQSLKIFPWTESHSLARSEANPKLA